MLKEENIINLILILIFFYMIYLIKSDLGISLSQKYHAWEIPKVLLKEFLGIYDD